MCCGASLCLRIFFSHAVGMKLGFMWCIRLFYSKFIDIFIRDFSIVVGFGFGFTPTNQARWLLCLCQKLILNSAVFLRWVFVCFIRDSVWWKLMELIHIDIAVSEIVFISKCIEYESIDNNFSTENEERGFKIQTMQWKNNQFCSNCIIQMLCLLRYFIFQNFSSAKIRKKFPFKKSAMEFMIVDIKNPLI